MFMLLLMHGDGNGNAGADQIADHLSFATAETSSLAGSLSLASELDVWHSEPSGLL